MRRRLLALTGLAAVAALAAGCGAGGGTVVVGDDPPSSTRYRVSATVLESPEHGPQLCHLVQQSYPPQCGGPGVVDWDWSVVDGEESANGTTWGDYEVTGTWDGSQLTMTEPPGPHRPDRPDEDPDLSTPCPVPAGGWQVVDPATTTDETLTAVTERAQELTGYAGVWLDQSINPAAGEPEPPEDAMNDPSLLVLNVSVTDERDQAEAKLREIWGGSLCVSQAQFTLAELRAIQAEVSAEVGAGFLSSSIDAVTSAVEMQVVMAEPDQQRDYDARYGPGAVRLTSWLQPVPQQER